MATIKVRITNYYSETETVDTDDGTRYIASIQSTISSFGTLMWSVTDQKTGKGVGGFARTVDEAKQAIPLFSPSLKNGRDSVHVNAD